MRNFKIILLGLFMFVSLASCKKQDMDENIKDETVTVNLKGTELYQYKISDAIPTEGGFQIRKQAENYQMSKMDWGTYHYQAKEGFIGTETIEVVLSTSIGDGNLTDEKRWIFEITIE